MHDVINAFLLIYAGLFPIVNPPGCAPLFLSLTQQRAKTQIKDGKEHRYWSVVENRLVSGGKPPRLQSAEIRRNSHRW